MQHNELKLEFLAVKQGFISLVPISLFVLIAIIAPMMITGDAGGELALIVTAIGTLVLHKPLA